VLAAAAPEHCRLKTDLSSSEADSFSLQYSRLPLLLHCGVTWQTHHRKRARVPTTIHDEEPHNSPSQERDGGNRFPSATSVPDCDL
jgi:hypothetical protein